MFGGRDPQQRFDEVHELNLLTHDWTLLSDVRYGYTYHSESNIDNNIYLFGGVNLLG